MALSDDQAMALLSAGVLLGRAPDVLSDFEHRLVSEVHGRWREHRREAVITDAEWPPLAAAIEAMRAAVAAGGDRVAVQPRLRSIGRAA
ncbi:hypothetical protein [Phenylobacterium ferrooxidans]|uniref:Uncharacterized protein n=1 Tax=Phenylobacterium ferrooxidans TaxID=2982689 RepID=A0ABW6CKC4_9CAUL